MADDTCKICGHTMTRVTAGGWTSLMCGHCGNVIGPTDELTWYRHQAVAGKEFNLPKRRSP